MYSGRYKRIMITEEAWNFGLGIAFGLSIACASRAIRHMYRRIRLPKTTTKSYDQLPEK